MKVTVEDGRKIVALADVPVGKCVLLCGGHYIFMRTSSKLQVNAPAWVRLNDGELFYTRELERGSSFKLVDAEVVIHG